MASTFAAAREILQRAIADRAFPAVTIEVGDSRRTLWRDALGRLTFDPESPQTRDDTIFDLASLTKVLATTALVMRQVERGALGLDDAVARYIPAWRDQGAVVVTIRDLLSHCSGLPAHVPFFREHTVARRSRMPSCAHRARMSRGPTSIYSDLGFMLLGFILESIAPLDDAIRRDAAADGWHSGTAVPSPARSGNRGRLPPGRTRGAIACSLARLTTTTRGRSAERLATRGCSVRWSRSASMHATCCRCWTAARASFTRETVEMFVARRSEIPDSSRALGWDTMLPTSSCGTRMSPRCVRPRGIYGDVVVD